MARQHKDEHAFTPSIPPTGAALGVMSDEDLLNPHAENTKTPPASTITAPDEEITTTPPNQATTASQHSEPTDNEDDSAEWVTVTLPVLNGQIQRGELDIHLAFMPPELSGRSIFSGLADAAGRFANVLNQEGIYDNHGGLNPFASLVPAAKAAFANPASALGPRRDYSDPADAFVADERQAAEAEAVNAEYVTLTVRKSDLPEKFLEKATGEKTAAADIEATTFQSAAAEITNVADDLGGATPINDPKNELNLSPTG